MHFKVNCQLLALEIGRYFQDRQIRAVAFCAQMAQHYRLRLRGAGAASLVQEARGLQVGQVELRARVAELLQQFQVVVGFQENKISVGVNRQTLRWRSPCAVITKAVVQ